MPRDDLPRPAQRVEFVTFDVNFNERRRDVVDAAKLVNGRDRNGNFIRLSHLFGVSGVEAAFAAEFVRVEIGLPAFVAHGLRDGRDIFHAPIHPQMFAQQTVRHRGRLKRPHAAFRPRPTPQQHTVNADICADIQHYAAGPRQLS